ncbi:MAG: SLBB domain-containing protein [Colwellia sp.]|nr:SLBB domain-containing protein [Colwellia sp.]MCW8864963.1 SLBB domain-containing protein [Colwellia sp.]MCW9082868.1 SLBB domain-containing protein [Colwellia sp.]
MISFTQKIVKKLILTSLLLTFSSSVLSEISTDQIEQFKRLPPAQQKALAQTMGVDINAIQAQLSKSGSASTMQENTANYPRGTQFDEQGNPIENKTDEEEEDFEQVEELKPFGYDVFANAPQTFAPTMDIAIPADYMVAPGDKVSIQVFGKETNELELEVNREGQIVFPQHGPFTVSGLSFAEMKRLLTAKIKEKIIGVDVVIGMASLRSMRVFVLGDAYRPGPYNLSSLSSITHAIFAAGGISDIGSLRNIQLKRAGKLVKTLDLYDLLIKGDSSDDVLLQSGDVVFVAPVGNTVSIEGEVRRPAIYELIKGDSFEDIVVMSGGLLPSAYAKSTIIERYNTNNLRSVINIDFSNNTQLAVKAQAGDAIRVLKAADMFAESVTLIGAITRPGKYQWQQGQKVADLLPQVDSHLLANADLSYSLIIRELDVARNIEVLQFGLAKAIENPESPDNITLHANDKVLVFSQVDKLSESSLELDMLAYTQEELFKKEQQLAKDKFKTKQFWSKYGRTNKLAEVEVDETAKLINQSIVQMSGGTVEEEVDVKELTLFSRQRLLLPIIQKLKRQGGSGQAIQLVEIDGSVKFPGVYPLAKNARVNDLILAAGGLDESAYLARADITRNQISSQFVSKRSLSVDLNAALQGDMENNLLLQSKDRLNIHQIPAWSENHVVELRGEFVFPGKYTIRRGESLSELIAKAGGFTSFAHQEGSVFTRVKLQELEQQNLFKLAGDLRVEMASKSLSDKGYSQSYAEVQEMLNDLTKLQPVGRLVLDLPKIVKDNAYDVLLEDGDVLYVPTLKNSVNVIGQVQVTSSHIYDASLTAEDYLAQSGGSKKRADEDRIYIIAANGSIKVMDNDNWFASDAGSNMKPGDTVVVPLDSEYMNNLTLWTSATTIMYNTAVAIAAISGI